MKQNKNLIGKVFGYLTVIEEAEAVISPNGQKIRRWKCSCVCGNIVPIREPHLKSGHTKSCGCFRKDIAKEHCIKEFSKPNKFVFSNDYVIGYANDEKEFLFDIEDYDKIKDFTWSINNRGYLLNKNGESFHRVVLNLNNLQDDKCVVDHINHNKLDNRKKNLRICQQIDNSHNMELANNNTSGVTGVQWMKDRNKWRAFITINYKKKYLGDFCRKEDAIKARKEAEEKYFKEYSYDNSMKLLEAQELIQESFDTTESV